MCLRRTIAAYLSRTICCCVFVVVVGMDGARASGGYTGVDLYPITRPGNVNLVFGNGDITGGGPSAAGGQIVATSDNGVMPQNVVLWDPSGAWSFLTPAGASSVGMAATNGAQQVGTVNRHAVLWNGSAASMVDLNPPGALNSEGLGTNGTQQVGAVNVTTAGGFAMHAYVWSGNAASGIDLDPNGTVRSFAEGTDGTHQVGSIADGSTIPTGSVRHATLWTGAAASKVDLSPTNLPYIVSSDAVSVSGGQEVGTGTVSSGAYHALLWTGSGDSAVDLNPAGAPDSIARATNGINQVGEMFPIGERHAVVWSGTAGSALDLHPLLPGRWTESMAYSIDADGNIFGIGVDTTGQWHAVEWQQTPEPASLALLGLGGLLLRRSRAHA